MTGEDDAATQIVGRGVRLPFGPDNKGSIALSAIGDVSGSIESIIRTEPGERVMRPEFGCEIWDYVYAPITPATLGQIEHAVTKALSRWEPRIELDAVDVTADPTDRDGAKVLISVDYRIRSSNDHRNLVFPFYVIPQESSS